MYDYAHIGNWRTFVFADLVRRTLALFGFEVNHVMNITDVEDKIIRRVAETRQSLRDFTARFEQAFFEDLRTLNCLPPHHTPRATEHIADIIRLIETLVERGLAYQAQDQSVYFSIDHYRRHGGTYGRLVNLNLEEMRVGERVRNDEYAKESVADFALWKARVPEDGNVFWPSPWGEGRPGWHIECSAMSMKMLGPSFDLHLGGEDLAFPHHEDEIAQSEGSGVQQNGQPFVRHWMHGAYLLVEGKKMAKSMGNFFTLRDLIDKGFKGREVRYLLLTAHYRETSNFTLDGLAGARTALGRIDECVGKLREIARTTAAEPDGGLVERFKEALADDLNISAAWATVFEWVREMNRQLTENAVSPAGAAAALAAWDQIDSVLGVGSRADTEAPPDILELVQARTAAKKARDFARADSIRDDLKARGWAVEDTPKGPKLKRLSS